MSCVTTIQQEGLLSRTTNDRGEAAWPLKLRYVVELSAQVVIPDQRQRSVIEYCHG